MKAALLVGDGVFATFAQLLFSRSRMVGAALLAACATEPRSLLCGLLAITVAALAVRALGLGEGAYGYNALLVGLGLGHAHEASGPWALVITCAAVLSVLVSATLAALAKSSSVPILTLPFIVTWWVLHSGLQSFGIVRPPMAVEPSGLAFTLLESLGSLLFLPHADAGALVLVALVMHSRIAALLAAAGAGLVVVVGQLAPALLVPPWIHGIVLNASFSAVALGGVFFVPSASSFVVAMAGAALSMMLSVGGAGVFSRLGLPSLIFPFNAAVLTVLFAMRERVFDRSPKSVDFVPGTPEENLAYFQSRLARFQALYAVSFHLPFRGAWVCTQGVDGTHTHKGAFRHAFDFEVRGDDGQLWRDDGARVDDHHCFKLPVLAAADGIVVKVVNDVPDNAVGAQDLRRNWGNVVIVRHAHGLHSLVAHLAQGSARVYEGQPVRRGDVLGLCGSSGRSPRPHLHFQLQATAQLGAPTLPCRFSDAIRCDDRERLQLAVEPREGETFRNVRATDEIGSFFRFEPGATLTFDGESIEHEIDLFGGLVLHSRDRGVSLHFDRTSEGFTAYDALGSSRSVLHLLRAALPRVPFDDAASLVWTDYVPTRGLRLGLFSSSGLTLEYRCERVGDRLVVRGASQKKLRDGTPLVTTTATLTRARGLVEVEVAVGTARHSAALVPS